MKLGNLTFDTIEYASRANAVVGIRDSGKTYSATNMAEQLMDSKERPGGIPITVFDPTGVWRFLRVPARGKGYPVVVVGGVDGDLPLNPTTIGKVIEGALIGGVSMVIDLSGDITKATMRKVVTECVTVMMAKNAKHGLRHVFLEEAAEFVPQNIGDPQVYAAVERMVRVGGNMGLGVTMVNPRTANLNKSVLELCDNLFLHRQKGKNSLKALRDWFDAAGLDEPADLSKSVSRLKSGECYAWLRDHEKPELLHVQQKNSFHPNRRDLQASSGSSTKRVDAGAFIKTLRESLPVIEAELKANDPKELRAEIAELKKQLAAKVPAAPAKGLTKEDEARLRSEGYNAGWAACMKQAVLYKAAVTKDWTGTYQKILMGNAEWLLNVVIKRDLPTILQEVALDIPKDLERNWREAFGADAEALSVAANFREPLKLEARPAPVSKPAVKPQFDTDATLPEGVTARHVAVLDAVAWWAAAGISAPSRVQVAGKCGHNASGGYFRDLLGRLSSAGLITYPRAGAVAITDQGRALVAGYDLATQADLHHAIEEALEARHWSLLKVLIDAYPNQVSRADLAAACGKDAAGGYFRDLVGKLSGLDMVTYPEKGSVRAADWLFIEGGA